MIQCRMDRFRVRVLPAMLAAAFSGVCANASAQAQALEEVIITAQKRSENLQDVPISVLSLNAKTLENRGVVSLADVNDGSVVGLNLAPYPGSADVFFPTFRGITTNSLFVTAPNPIAVHLNGVFLSQLVGLSNPAADLERIEILKGPQGVMSGRNATGGALNIFTAKPTLGEFDFKQQITFADRKQFLSKTVVNVPLSDTVAAKVAYLNSSRDSQGVNNSAPGGVKFGEHDSDAWRFDVRWKPNNAFTLDYGYDYSLSKGYDTPAQCLYASPTYVAMAAGGAGDSRNVAFVNGCRPDKQDSLYFPFAMGKNRNEAQGHTLNLEWIASPTLTLRSITGYRKVDTLNNYNYGAYVGAADVRADSAPFTVTGAGGFTLGTPVKLVNEAWSQEFQFLGAIAPNLKYTAGVYYSSEKGSQHSGPNVGMYMPGAVVPGVDMLMIDAKGINSATSKSVAIFGQLNWTPDILDKKLEIIPGVRFTRDHRRADGYNTGWTMGYPVVATGVGTGILPFAAFPIAAPDVGFTSSIGDRTFSQATPALSFDYHWNDRLMSYLKFAKGYTSGGFDAVSGGATAADFSKGFDAETIKSFELGLKGEFMERRLRTNMALFQSKYTKEQKSVALPTGGWKTENVGGSTYEGFEFDLTAALTERARLGFSYATLSHKYTSWIDPTTGADVTALRKLIVPKDDFTVNLDYRFPGLGLPGRLDGTLSYFHRDRTSTPLNLVTPNVELYSTTPAFGLWNARIALSQLKVGPEKHGDLTVALWAKNLTDKKYINLSYQGWTSAGSASWGDPRSVGLDLIYQY